RKESGFMEYLFKIQEKIVPELISVAEKRYNILRNIYYNQPIGRRALAGKTFMSERSIRKELNFLQSRGLIDISRSGAEITETGTEFLAELDKYIKEVKGIRFLEESIKALLGIKGVFIVPGNLEHSTIKQEIGRFTARLLKRHLKNGDILAVTGGSTLACVARSMRDGDKKLDVLVVPGRGGLGEDVEIQANTIAATIARKLNGCYQLLHIPDSIKEENVNRILIEPSIRRILSNLKKANILLHGVGSAEEMARRRDMSEEEIRELIKKGAVGEALGYYFNEEGKIVYTTTSVGLHLEDLKNIEKVIVVAADPAKARAIISVVSPVYHDILITDELTAKEIIKLKGGDAGKEGNEI
ncbi:MAG TPA: sugar-binding domain-containing protein, partial [Halanaerobiales bacterium]|nr:sugar-binding domain-containing protein [Halanaerobiales bacterium]